MSRSTLETMQLDDFLQGLSAAHRELAATHHFLASETALDALRRLNAQDRQITKCKRYVAPLSLCELALPSRLRNLVIAGDVPEHAPVFLEAATRIERLEGEIWKLPAAPVHSNQVSTEQLTHLLSGNVANDRHDETIEALQSKGFIDDKKDITRAGHSFIWRLMENHLDRSLASRERGEYRIIRMDSEMIALQDQHDDLEIADWNGHGFAAMAPAQGIQPLAILHPYYVWQLRIQSSAGQLLNDRIHLPWRGPRLAA